MWSIFFRVSMALASMALASRDTVNLPAVLALGAVLAVHYVSWSGMAGNAHLPPPPGFPNYEPHPLPGLNLPILSRLVGTKPDDSLPKLAGLMFASVTDISHPPLWLVGWYFAGQPIGVLAVTMVEGLRRGNKNTWIE